MNGGKDGNIQDQNGHGTFVAGVVGAVTNNALGVVGINQVRLPPLFNEWVLRDDSLQGLSDKSIVSCCTKVCLKYQLQTA